MTPQTIRTQEQRGTGMINRLAGEIIGMIMEYLDDRWENPNNKLKLEYPSTLHACSLVKLEWRSLAQRVLHRKLRVHYCNLAHQRRCYGPSLGSYAGGLGLFPRELSIEHINIACTKLSEDLYALSKYCGERITRLNLYNTSFASFSNFLELLKCFPHLKRLDVRDCSWKDTSLGFWDGCAGHEDCQCSCPRAPISLQQVFVDLGEETVPLPLAQWLIHARVTTLQSLAWVFKFSLMDVSAPYTTEALHVLGPHLSYVTLDVDVSEEWSDEHQLKTFPDLSHNTQLYNVDLQNVVPGYCPRYYLTSIFSSLNSEALDSVAVQYTLDGTDIEDLKSFALDEFDSMLSDRKRFPHLGWVNFHAVQDSNGPSEAEPLLSNSVRENMPELVRSKDISIHVMRSFVGCGDDGGHEIIENAHVQ